MFGRVGAGIKGAMGARLSYEELASLVERLLINPPLTDTLRESIASHWQRSDGRSFNQFWREERILPHLRMIAEQPTRALQKQRLIGLVLDETEAQAVCGLVNQFSDEEAEAILFDYPSEATSNNSIEWKRLFYTYEFMMSACASSVLLVLGQDAFGIETEELSLWTDLHTEAFRFMAEVRFNLRSMHVKAIRDFSAADALIEEEAAEPMFRKMNLSLSAIRDDICNQRYDVERHRRQFNAMVDARDERYEQITGRPAPRDTGERL